MSNPSDATHPHHYIAGYAHRLRALEATCQTADTLLPAATTPGVSKESRDELTELAGDQIERVRVAILQIAAALDPDREP